MSRTTQSLVPEIARKAKDLLSETVSSLQRTRRRRGAKDRELAFRAFASLLARPYRLHIGCGTVHFPGWINVDDESGKAADVLWDATLRFPLPEGSCSLVYNEHFLEHLPVQEGVRFLKECHRLLAPGGVLRIAMPSLLEAARHYCENDWRDQPWLSKYGYTWISTGAEFLNIVFREWGHQWLYDEEELSRRLREAGFSLLATRARGQSDHAELTGRETRDESLLVMEATKSGGTI